MYALQVIDCRQEYRARRLVYSFRGWILSEEKSSPLTFKIGNVDVAIVCLQLLSSNNIRAKVAYQI